MLSFADTVSSYIQDAKAQRSEKPQTQPAPIPIVINMPAASRYRKTILRDENGNMSALIDEPIDQ